jgi:hypothetical protein
VGEDDGADVGEALAQVVVLEALVGGPHVDAEPVVAFVGGLAAGPVQQLGPQTLAPVRPVDRDLVGVWRGLGGLLWGPKLGLGPSG